MERSSLRAKIEPDKYATIRAQALPGESGETKMSKKLVERRISRNGDDVRPRNHDVADAALAQAQHIGEHGALLRRKIGELAILLCQCLDDFLAGRTAAAQAEPIKELAKPVSEAAAVGFVL